MTDKESRIGETKQWRALVSRLEFNQGKLVAERATLRAELARVKAQRDKLLLAVKDEINGPNCCQWCLETLALVTEHEAEKGGPERE